MLNGEIKMKLLFDGSTREFSNDISTVCRDAINNGIHFLQYVLKYEKDATLPNFYQRGMQVDQVGKMSYNHKGFPYIYLSPYCNRVKNYDNISSIVKHEILHFYLYEVGSDSFGDGEKDFDYLAEKYDIVTNNSQSKKEKLLETSYINWFLSFEGTVVTTEDYEYLWCWKNIPKNSTILRRMQILEDSGYYLDTIKIVYHKNPTKMSARSLRRNSYMVLPAVAVLEDINQGKEFQDTLAEVEEQFTLIWGDMHDKYMAKHH